MPTPLRLALVGYGSSGRTIHAPLLRAEPGLEVTDVVTGDRERAEAALAEHPGVFVHPSPEALWRAVADGERAVDVVVLASPNAAHAEQALAAIGLGIPVVVDKPLALTAQEARGVVDAALAAGVGLTVFQNRRWDGEHRALRRLLDDDALGRVLRYEARFERWRPQPKDRWREQLPGEQGGGLLLDLQSHLVDGALHLFGPAVDVLAELESVTTVGEDVTFLRLRHECGVVSHLSATSLAGAPGPRTRVLGTEASYVVAGVDDEPTPWAALADAPGSRGWLLRGDEREPVERADGDWSAFYAAVVPWVRGESRPPVDPADAVATLAVLDAARTSARTGQVQAVGGRAQD
ncbi:MAG: Gfo/Idh/MocA family protein [Motilibacteraceae bacterium]